MLVLSRKANETIRIGNSITITVTKIAGNRAKLGIVAPKGVQVLRGELVTDWRDGAESSSVADERCEELVLA